MPFQPEPVPVTLSDVYPFDFGRRSEDVALWAALQAVAGPGPTCEACVGDGRASAALTGDVYGIDIDPVFVRRARERGLRAFAGDVSRPEPWASVPGDCALVFCAFSGLFLLSHEKQEAVLRLMARHLRPGGILAVETFVPSMLSRAEMDAPVANPNSPLEAKWTRRTTYEVEPGQQGLGRTRARRLYGPTPGDWRMELDEVVYWRTPANLARVVADICGQRVTQETGGRVPPGSVLTTWSRS